MVETQTKKEEILKLVKAINASPRRLKKNLYPLEPVDDGWRIVFPKSLELYDFCKEGRKLLQEAVYDLDFRGGYYWIPYSDPPKGVTTPALRLMRL